MRSKLLLATRLVMVSRLVVRIRLLLLGSRLEEGYTWLVVTKLLVGTMTRLLLKFKSGSFSRLPLQGKVFY